MRPERGAPPPFRRRGAPGSHSKRIINKLQSREKGDGSLGVGLLPVLFFGCPLSVHFLWFGPGPVHLGGGNTHTRLVGYRWRSPQGELPRGGVRLDNTLEVHTSRSKSGLKHHLLANSQKSDLQAAVCGEGGPVSLGRLLQLSESWGVASRPNRGLHPGGPSHGTSFSRMGSG